VSETTASTTVWPSCRKKRSMAGRESRPDAKALGFQRRDDAVVVAGIARQQVGAQHQQADDAVHGALQRAGQCGAVFGQPCRQARVVDADLGVLQRRQHLGHAAQATPRTAGTTVDDVAHEVEHVLVGTTQEVLHGDEVRPHVLCRARDEAQQLRQPAQHLHLRGAAGGLLVLVAAQLLQQRHGAAGRLVHVEGAQARELHDLGRRHHADHRVAGLAAGAQRVDDGQEVVFQEQHADDDDVGARDVGVGAGDGRVVAGVFRRRVHAQREARELARQSPAAALGGAGHVGVHAQHHHMDRRLPRADTGRGRTRLRQQAHLHGQACQARGRADQTMARGRAEGFSGRNGLWRHTESRP
jgi:hypothetical protein